MSDFSFEFVRPGIFTTSLVLGCATGGVGSVPAPSSGAEAPAGGRGTERLADAGSSSPGDGGGAGASVEALSAWARAIQRHEWRPGHGLRERP